VRLLLNMSIKKYAGIGARKTPEHIIIQMIVLADTLAQRGWVLRSGGALGADTAFEIGCDYHEGAKEIFLPFPNHNGSQVPFIPISPSAYQLVDEMYSDAKNRSHYVRTLWARNAHIILGANLDDPVDVVICWTPGSNVVGGTGRAIKIAHKYQIPVVYINDNMDNDRLLNLL